MSSTCVHEVSDSLRPCSPLLPHAPPVALLPLLPALEARRLQPAAHSAQRQNGLGTLAILFAVGAQKLMSLFMSSTSRTDTFQAKRLIESCGIVSQLKATQTKELLVDRFWPHVYASTSQMMQDEDCGAILAQAILAQGTLLARVVELFWSVE